jgi:hypothetical protein
MDGRNPGFDVIFREFGTRSSQVQELDSLGNEMAVPARIDPDPAANSGGRMQSLLLKHGKSGL